jgi:quinol monooxygenase YgiN
MYGTVAKLKFQADKADEALKTVSASEEAANPEGAVATYVFRMDSDPSEFYLVVLFDDKETYFANADDPKTNDDYERMAKFFAAEPEWHDGEVVFARRFK